MTDLPAPSETGALGVMHLMRAWARSHYSAPADPQEGHRDRLVFHALGLGLKQTVQCLGANASTFEAFEYWIANTTGRVPSTLVARINVA